MFVCIFLAWRLAVGGMTSFSREKQVTTTKQRWRADWGPCWNVYPRSKHSTRQLKLLAQKPTCRLAQVLVQPVERALADVAAVLGFGDGVALVGIDHQLGFDAQGLEGMPKFVGLRRRALGVPLAN
jgi:hypothetical protein